MPTTSRPCDKHQVRGCHRCFPDGTSDRYLLSCGGCANFVVLRAIQPPVGWRKVSYRVSNGKRKIVWYCPEHPAKEDKGEEEEPVICLDDHE